MFISLWKLNNQNICLSSLKNNQSTLLPKKVKIQNCATKENTHSIRIAYDMFNKINGN